MKEDGESLSVTVINTQQLPTYSAERFYMLSEIEQMTHSTLFLCDFACDQTEDTVETTSENSECQSFPPFCVLYILWRPQMVSSVRVFVESIIRDYIQQVKDSSSKDTRLYLVIDTLVPETASEEDDAAKHRRYRAQVHVAESLARHVAQAVELRTLVEGITVAVANNVRAAPGMELIMEAMGVGSKTRRHHDRESRSLVGLTCSHPDELLGLADSETDAVQDVLQSTTCAEWGGYGDLKSFANRAHAQWCDANGVQESKPNKRRGSRRYRAALERTGIMDDPLLSFVMIISVAWIYFHCMVHYRDQITTFLQRVADVVSRR